MSRLCFLFLFLMSVGAGAQNFCEPVDLRPQLPAVRDQGDTGWCFAYTTADLVSQKTGRAVSAVDVAATFLLGNQELLKNHPHPAIQHYLALHPGFFRGLFKSRMSEPVNYSRGKILGDEGLLNTGGEEDDAAFLLNLKNLCTEESLPSVPMTNLPTALHEIQKKLVGTIQDPVAREMALRFQRYVDQHCRRFSAGGPIIPHMLQAAESLNELDQLIRQGRARFPAIHKVMMTEVDRRLSQGKAVAIGYNAYDLILNPGNDKDGDHSSLIVARRLIQGRCHYFVRNAWGVNCAIYRPELRGLCEAPAGGVWVPHEALRTLYSVVSLE